MDGQQARLDLAVAVATQEVADLQRQLQNLTAAGQLAGLVAEQAQAGSYRSRLGLMTQIRTDFERMAQLLGQASHEPEKPTMRPATSCPRSTGSSSTSMTWTGARPAGWWTCSRRSTCCWPWSCSSWSSPWTHGGCCRPCTATTATSSPPPRPPPGRRMRRRTLWRPSAVQYLEKIFQVVLTLPPLATGGYTSLVDSLINPQDETTRTTGTGTATAGEPARQAAAAQPAAAGTAPGTGGAAGPGSEQEEPGPGIVDLPAPVRVLERGDPLAFSAGEQRLLHLLGPPLITTPRAAKRLANSYGLLSALHPSDLAASRDGDEPGWRAAMVLLATLVGYPELGPVLFPHIHQQAAASPDAPWAGLADGLHPHRDDGAWRNEARAGLDDAQAQHWESLARALASIEACAAQQNVPLPCTLATWAQWIEPVGRLSFPTGRVVSALDRHPPLPTP